MVVVKENKFETWFSKTVSIDENLQEMYMHRLNVSLKSTGIFQNFEEQYKQGSGNELKSKFWSRVSSSRLAFDLYSWIINEPNCVDFQFEKKLPGIISGRTETPANMDVYIRSSNSEIWFIESKFTEKPAKRTMKKLPEAYYATLTKNGTQLISFDTKAISYYHNTSKKLVAKPIFERFRKHDTVIGPFTEFCKVMLEKEQDYEQKWFDSKQETCHLFGIIMYLLENYQELKGYKIHFLNIVYNKEDGNYISEEHFANVFMEAGRRMISEILAANKINDLTFDYRALSIQDVISEYGNKIAFENSGKTVRQTIRENFCGLPI